MRKRFLSVLCLLMLMGIGGNGLMGQATTLTLDGCFLKARTGQGGTTNGCIDETGASPNCKYTYVLLYNDLSGGGYVEVDRKVSCANGVSFPIVGVGRYRLRVLVWSAVGDIVLNNGETCRRLVQISRLSFSETVSQMSGWDLDEMEGGENADRYLAVRASSSDQKVYYMSYNRMWNMYNPGPWDHAALSWSVTNVAGPIAPMPGSSSEIFYRGTDSKMHVFDWTGSSWTSSELSSSVTNVASGGQIQARPGKVYYRGTDGNIWNFYQPGGVWNAAPLGWGDNASGQLVVLNGGEVVFRGNDSRLYEYSWSSGSGWTRTQVGSYNSVSADNLTTTGNDVWFRNNSGGMMRATKSGSSWTVSSMGGSNNLAGDLSASVDNPTHVYYRGDYGRLWQFYRLSNGTWSQVCLEWDDDNVKGPVAASSGLVFYRANNNDLWEAEWKNCPGKRSGQDVLEETVATVNSLTLYPNPAHDRVTVEVEVAEATELTVVVYDLMGQRVCELARSEWVPAGLREMDFSVTDLPAGMYIVQATGNGQRISKRLTVR